MWMAVVFCTNRVELGIMGIKFSGSSNWVYPIDIFSWQNILKIYGNDGSQLIVVAFIAVVSIVKAKYYSNEHYLFYSCGIS
jgi:hypothetical protein